MDHNVAKFKGTGGGFYSGNLGFHTGSYASADMGIGIERIIFERYVLLDGIYPVRSRIEAIIGQFEAYFRDKNQPHCQAYT